MRKRSSSSQAGWKGTSSRTFSPVAMTSRRRVFLLTNGQKARGPLAAILHDSSSDRKPKGYVGTFQPSQRLVMFPARSPTSR